MMRENWTEGGEDDEEGKRRRYRKREREKEKERDRKMIEGGKKGDRYGTAGLRGQGGKRAWRERGLEGRKGRSAVVRLVSLRLRGRKEGEE